MNSFGFPSAKFFDCQCTPDSAAESFQHPSKFFVHVKDAVGDVKEGTKEVVNKTADKAKEAVNK